MNNVEKLRLIFLKFNIRRIGFFDIENFCFDDISGNLKIERDIELGKVIRIPYELINTHARFEKDRVDIAEDFSFSFYTLQVADLSKIIS